MKAVAAAAGRGSIKASVGFCREDFDVNKNQIQDQKKKVDYWMLDLFDGEAYSSKIVASGQPYLKYMQPQNYIRIKDVLGVELDMDMGTISYYKNGQPLGICFQEGMAKLSKGKIYPLISLYKCKVTAFGGAFL